MLNFVVNAQESSCFFRAAKTYIFYKSYCMEFDDLLLKILEYFVLDYILKICYNSDV